MNCDYQAQIGRPIYAIHLASESFKNDTESLEHQSFKFIQNREKSRLSVKNCMCLKSKNRSYTRDGASNVILLHKNFKGRKQYFNRCECSIALAVGPLRPIYEYTHVYIVIYVKCICIRYYTHTC